MDWLLLALLSRPPYIGSLQRILLNLALSAASPRLLCPSALSRG